MLRAESLFAKANGQARLSGSTVTKTDDLGDVIPWLGHEVDVKRAPIGRKAVFVRGESASVECDRIWERRDEVVLVMERMVSIRVRVHMKDVWFLSA